MTKRMQKILLGFSLLLAVPFVAGYGLYYGYCHSWWSKENLLFRSMWLCSCPAGFEETLYPDYVEVVFSACNEVRLFHVFPDDRYLLVDNDESRPGMPRYFWDPLTDARIPLNIPGEIWNTVLGKLEPITFLDENTYLDNRNLNNRNVIYVKENIGKELNVIPNIPNANFATEITKPEIANLLALGNQVNGFMDEDEDRVRVYLIPPPTSSILVTVIRDEKKDGIWI